MATEQKPNIIQRFVNWSRQTIQETIGELRKVHWSSREEAFRLTQVVLIVLAVMGLLLGTLDLLYSQLFKLLLGI